MGAIRLADRSTKTWINKIVVTRLNTNRNFLAAIAGDTGSGKSYSALWMAEAIDSKFTVKQVAFTPIELVTLIEKAKKGSCIIMDEAGVSYGAREFSSKFNIALGHIFQAFRFKNVALIWTMPDLRMIDINARRLMHAYIETKFIDYKRNLVALKWFNIRTDRWNGDPIHEYPKVIIGDKGIKTLTTIYVPKPSEGLIKQYEAKKKKAFNSIIENTKKLFTPSASAPKVDDIKRSLQDKLG